MMKGGSSILLWRYGSLFSRGKPWAFRAQGNPQDTTWTGPGSVLGSRHYAVAGFFAGCPVQSSDPLNDVL